MNSPEPRSVETAVASALAGAGILGITPKQIATTTRLPLPEVEAEIRSLSDRERIERVGRGLWVLRKWGRQPETAPGFRGPEWYDAAFRAETHVSTGTYLGALKFTANERLPVHRWWPYVQGFSADFVAHVFDRYLSRPLGSVVLDPYCGSGTVAVVARLRGARAIGIDRMPIAAFAARAKQNWEVDPSRLVATARRVTRPGRPGPRPDPPFLRETPRQFPKSVMESLLTLKGRIWDLEDGPVKTGLELAFASILIDSSRLKRAPCLGYAPKRHPSRETPRRLFRRAVGVMASDLEGLRSVRASWGPPAEIVLGDSRTVELGAESVDLAVTSPPYVNGMDYVMNYKIDLAWMDLARSYADLRDLKASMVACDNLPRSAVLAHPRSPVVAHDAWISPIVAEIAGHIAKKAIYRRDDMGDIVAKYFDDLLPTLRNVFRWLRPGGRFVVVNGDSLIAGTYVPGDLIFARLGATVGFEIEALDVGRKRRSGQRRGFLLRESVLTLRKPARDGLAGEPRPSVRRSGGPDAPGLAAREG